MDFLKSKKSRYKVDDIEKIIEDHKVLEFAGSGDPHEEFGKMRLLLKNVEPCSLDMLLFDGDYLAEPAYLKTKHSEDDIFRESVDKLQQLISILQVSPAPVLCVAGNYEIPGTTHSAVEATGASNIFDIGTDATATPHEIHLYKDEDYMDVRTARKTWPGGFHKAGDFGFLGVEGSNPINYTFPGERTEEDIDWALRTSISKFGVSPDNLIIATHAPPFGFRDQLGRFGVPPHLWGARKGSTALRNYSDENWPFMTVVGHIHEAFGLHARSRSEEDGTQEELLDVGFSSRQKYLLAYDTSKKRISITLNKGTLELWNWSRVRIAQVGTIRLVDIEAEWLDRKARRKPFKKYAQVVELDDAIASLTT